MSEEVPESVGPKGPPLPSFDKRRRQNDAVMVPDRGFTKQLKALDEELEVVWNWGEAFWEIWRFPKDKNKQPVHLVSVTTRNKTYRDLGADVLLRLQEARQLAELPLEKLVAYFDALDEQLERRKRRDFLNKLEAVANYTFNLAVGIPTFQVPKSFKIGRVAHASKS